MLTQNNIGLVQTHSILLRYFFKFRFNFELLNTLFCFAFPDDWLERLEEPGKDIFPGTESETIKCPLGNCVS